MANSSASKGNSTIGAASESQLGLVNGESARDLIGAASDTARGLVTTQAQTLSGKKTFNDGVDVCDPSDHTKKISFDASGLPTGTTRVMKAPAADGELATMRSVVDGSVGSCMEFDGFSSKVQLPGGAVAGYSSSDFSMIMTLCVRAWDADDVVRRHVDSNGYGYLLGIDSTGKLKFVTVDSVGFGTSVIPESSNVGNYSSVAVTRRIVGSSEYHSAWVDGVKTLTDNAQTKRNWPSSIATSVIGESGAASAYFKGSVRRVVEFNYALPEDKVQRYSAGAKLDWDDVGGSMTELITDATARSFSSDSGYWTKDTGVTISGGVCTFTNVSTGGLYKSALLTPGKRYRITLTVSSYTDGSVGVPTAYSNVFRRTKNGVEQTVGNFADSAGTWTFEFIQVQDAPARIYIGMAGTDLSIDNISVIQLGAVLDLEPENITDLMWVDASPNGLHGTVTNAKANRFVPSYSSRNHFKNGSLDIWQRATTSTQVDAAITDAYIADRFKWVVSGSSGGTGSRTCARDTDVPAELNTSYSIALSVSTLLSASRLTYLYYAFEHADAHLLLNKTVTISFWAKASVALTTTGPGFNVVGNATGPSIDLGTSWRRYSWTTKITSVSGTNPEDVGLYVSLLQHQIPAGVTIKIAGIMLNEGPVAAPFERAGGSIGGELALCRRYCRPAHGNYWNKYINGANEMRFNLPTESLKTMLSTPSLQVVSSVVEGTDFFVLNGNGTTQTGWTVGVINDITEMSATKTAHGLVNIAYSLFLGPKYFFVSEL